MESQNKPLLCAAFLVAVWALSCAFPIKTGFDMDPAADLSQYKTFAWVGPGPLSKAKSGMNTPSFISPFDDQRIRSSVNRTLESLGYWLVVPPEVADMVVAYSVGSEEKVRVHQSPGRVAAVYPYGGRYQYGGWHATSSVSVEQYKEGTLSIEFYDGKTEQAVWIGWASKRLSRSDDSRTVISEAVAKILQEFPSARGSSSLGFRSKSGLWDGTQSAEPKNRSSIFPLSNSAAGRGEGDPRRCGDEGFAIFACEAEARAAAASELAMSR